MTESPTKNLVLLVLSLLASASTWFYVDRILVPYQINDAVEHSRPRGNLSDLYPRWLGARALLLQGRDPYRPEVTREIQAGYYGRELDAHRPGDPQDQQAFAYPVYVAFLLAPSVKLPFGVVQRGFNIALWVLTGASVLLWLRTLRWRPPASVIAVFVLLMLGSIPAVQGIKLQQLSLLVAAMLAGSAALLVAGYFVPAGILLAFATIKPQLTWLLVLWLLVWSVNDWRRRRKFALSFVVTMLVLLGAAEWMLPGWATEFWTAVQNYHQYTHNMSVLGWLLTPTVGNVAAALLVMLTGFLCWPTRTAANDSAAFGSAITLVVGLTVLIVPMFAPYNQVLLLPAVMVQAREVRNLWSRGWLARLLYGILVLVLFWPWVSSVVLMAMSFVLPPSVVQGAWKLPFFTTFTMPLIVFGLLAYGFRQISAPDDGPASRG